MPLNTVVAGSVAGQFVEPNDSAAVNAQVAVNDTVVLNLNPAGNYTTATFKITGNYANGEDVLTFANDGVTMGDIAGNFNVSTGTLTLTSATATPTQWQAALRAIRTTTPPTRRRPPTAR